jgi:hypothetical protein
VLAEQLAERPPLAGVFHREVQGLAGHAHGERPDARAEQVERLPWPPGTPPSRSPSICDSSTGTPSKSSRPTAWGAMSSIGSPDEPGASPARRTR